MEPGFLLHLTLISPIECKRTMPQIGTPVCIRCTTAHQFLWQQQHTCGAVGGSSMELGVGVQHYALQIQTLLHISSEWPSQEEPGSGSTAFASVSDISAPACRNGICPPLRPVSLVHKNNRGPCCPPMSNSSTSPWTARPDDSGWWDNGMAAQHLPRDLVRPSSGENNWLKRRRRMFHKDLQLAKCLRLLRRYNCYWCNCRRW